MTQPTDEGRPFDLYVATDRRAAASGIAEELVREGVVRSFEVDELPSDPPAGFRLWTDPDDAVAWRLRRLVDASLRRVGVLPIYRLHSRRLPPLLPRIADATWSSRARLDLPLAGADSGRLLRRILARRDMVKVWLRIPPGAEVGWLDLADRLDERGYRAEFVDRDDGEEPFEMRCGGVAEELLDEIEAFGLGLAPEIRFWRTTARGSADRAVELVLPERHGHSSRPGGVPGSSTRGVARAVLGRAHAQGDRTPFVRVESDRIRIGRVELPVRDAEAAVAALEQRFAHVCFDAQTAHTLEFLAESFVLAEPALLTGAAGAGKSELAGLLAELVGLRCVRLAFGADVDADHLLGRFQPDEDGMALSRLFEAWIEHRTLLDSRSIEVLERADREGRALTAVEVHRLHRWEGITGSGFRWLDGALVDAVRHGGIVLLDEINLAPTEVLERINPLLEVPPSLTLGERGTDAFGAGGIPVHGDFRIVATRNPTDHTGRQPMSPALLSRFAARLHVSAPDEVEHEQALRLWVYGEQPAVEVNGERYAGWTVMPDPRLGALAGREDILTRLALFHAGVDRASVGPEDPYGDALVTRRTLRAALRYLAVQLAADQGDFDRALRRALWRYYVDVAPEEQREARVELMLTFGLARDERGVEA